MSVIVISKVAIAILVTFAVAGMVGIGVGLVLSLGAAVPAPVPCVSPDVELSNDNDIIVASLALLTAQFDTLKYYVDPHTVTLTIAANTSVGLQAPLSTTFILHGRGLVTHVSVLDVSTAATVNATSAAYIEYPWVLPAGFCINVTANLPLHGSVMIGGLLAGAVVPTVVLYVPSTPPVLRFLLPTLPDNPLATTPVFKIDGTNNTVTAGNLGQNLTVLDSSFMFRNDCFKVIV